MIYFIFFNPACSCYVFNIILSSGSPEPAVSEKVLSRLSNHCICPLHRKNYEDESPPLSGDGL